MNKTIRLGTRDSQLALWQAEFIAGQLRRMGVNCEIHKVKSEGDINLSTPLYEMGIQGIFTKALDMALLDNKIDIAVHSFKDVPTALPAGLMIAAIPQRGIYSDTFVSLDPIDSDTFSKDKLTVATGSIRRRAQWLHRYPHHDIVPLRGNVITRIDKLRSNGWDGAIFATAGLQRLDIRGVYRYELPFIPAPGQGALAIVARQNDELILEKVRKLNHEDTAFCVTLEKIFLKTLEGGCSSPIACLTTKADNSFFLRGELYDPSNFSKVYYTELIIRSPLDAQRQVKDAAMDLLNKKSSSEK